METPPERADSRGGSLRATIGSGDLIVAQPGAVSQVTPRIMRRVPLFEHCRSVSDDERSGLVDIPGHRAKPYLAAAAVICLAAALSVALLQPLRRNNPQKEPSVWLSF